MLSDSLTRISALKAELDSLRPLSRENELRLWEKLRLEWNYNSNHIEGNTLTYGETFLLLIHGHTNGGHTMREFEEMKAHDVAVSMVKEWAQDKDRSLSENDVRSLNEVLLKEPFWKQALTPDGQHTQTQVFPGKYKTMGNSVRQPDGSLFNYAGPEEVPGQMRELMEWYNASSDLHPVQKVAILHHRFILIHPFGDGNGRTARLLVNYHLMRHGYMPLVVKSADKSNYLRSLKEADAGDLIPFTEYLAEAEQWALELAMKAVKGEKLDESSDWQKRADILFREVDGRLRSDKDLDARWRAKVSRWLDLNFDEMISQIRNKILIFEKFYGQNSFTYMIQATRLQGTYQPAFAKIKKSDILDLWNTKGMSTVAVNLTFKKYKFNGIVADKAFLFTLNFEHEHVRVHWYKPEKVDELVGYNDLLVDRPLLGLDRGAAWILADIEKAQSASG